jgi:Ser/Thr protein kinase RdoA (MazF antagonist)
VIAERFAIPTDVDEVVPFGDGLINDTYLVRAGDQEFVLQRINDEVFGDLAGLMHNVATVTAHLAGALVPELVAARDGGWIVTDGTDTWRMWRRVRGAEPCNELTPARVSSAAALIGRFQVALSDLPADSLPQTIPRFHDPQWRLTLLRDAIAADPCQRVEHVGSEIERAFAAEALAAKATEFMTLVPPQIAHNDAQINNVLFRGDDAVCLVDLDTVMPTRRFWDVGDLLRSGSTRRAEDDPSPQHNAVDPALHRAIVDGYCEIVQPDGIEADAVAIAGLLITYEQALRFLTDYLRGDIYYRTTREGQNLDRTRGQLALLASMQDMVES